MRVFSEKRVWGPRKFPASESLCEAPLERGELKACKSHNWKARSKSTSVIHARFHCALQFDS